jgi:hypothetical protein
VKVYVLEWLPWDVAYNGQEKFLNAFTSNRLLIANHYLEIDSFSFKTAPITIILYLDW